MVLILLMRETEQMSWVPNGNGSQPYGFSSGDTKLMIAFINLQLWRVGMPEGVSESDVYSKVRSLVERYRELGLDDKTMSQLLTESSFGRSAAAMIIQESREEAQTPHGIVPDPESEEAQPPSPTASDDEEPIPEQENAGSLIETPSTTENDVPEEGTEGSKSVEEYDREEDVFSPEEFEKLENKESDSLLTRVFKTKKDTDVDEKPEKQEDSVESLSNKELSRSIQQLTTKTDELGVGLSRLEGKFELVGQKTEGFNDRLKETLEKIGELRSTVLGRERMFNKLEDEFSQVKYVVNAFKPENLDKHFDEVLTKIAKFVSYIEKIEHRQKVTDEKITRYLEIMERIGNYEQLLRKLEELKEEEKRISGLKVDIERMTSKVQIIHENLQDTVRKVNGADSRSQSNLDTIRELLVSTTKIETQQDFFVKKKDIQRLEKDLGVLKKALFSKDFEKFS